MLQDSTVDAEAGGTPKNIRKRKTTINDPSHGSFFLRVGALGKSKYYLNISSMSIV